MSECLGGYVAVGVQAAHKIFVFSNVVKLVSEISEIVDIGRHFFRSPSHFFQFDGSMEGHFCLRSLHFESRIPGSSSRAIEASSGRIWVSKRRVHDMREPEARNQLNGAYAR